MSSSASNISISPVNVKWQIETSEQVDLAGLTASGLGGKYFNIWSAADATAYYVWFDENNTDVDPAPASKTAVEVDYAAGATATAIATALAAALDGLGDFVASSSGTVVTVSRPQGSYGETTDTVDVDSGAAITVCRRGKDFDLGLLQGDVEMSAAPSVFTVTAEQSGVTPRAQLFQGFESMSVSVTMLETITSNLAEIYAQYGATWTPTGSSVTSLGTSRQGENLLVDAARLVLKPVNAANDLDNVVLMLAVPVPESLVFSGENPKTLSVTFNGLVDDQMDTRASVLVIGDQTQQGLRT